MNIDNGMEKDSIPLLCIMNRDGSGLHSPIKGNNTKQMIIIYLRFKEGEDFCGYGSVYVLYDFLYRVTYLDNLSDAEGQVLVTALVFIISYYWLNL